MKIADLKRRLRVFDLEIKVYWKFKIYAVGIGGIELIIREIIQTKNEIVFDTKTIIDKRLILNHVLVFDDEDYLLMVKSINDLSLSVEDKFCFKITIN